MSRMRRVNENIGIRIAMAVLAMAFLLLSLAFSPRVAYADTYDSWVRDKTGGYDTTQKVGEAVPKKMDWNAEGLPEPSDKKSKLGSVQKDVSTVIVNIGLYIAQALKTGNTDMSSTGVIMGHITSGSGTSIFVFDLMPNNIYGIAGALLYTIFRTLVLCFIFILAIWQIVRAMLLGEMESYRAMKDTVAGMFITMMILFLMPQVVDWACTVRNAMSIFLYDKIVQSGIFDPDAALGVITKTEMEKAYSAMAGGMMPTGETTEVTYKVSSLDGVYYAMWEEYRSIPNALVFIMVSIVVPLAYMFNYMKIAVIQLVMFGAFPLFALVGMKDKSILSKWMCTFISNIFVPVIDLSIMFIPALIMKKLDSGALVSGFLKALIICAIFLSVIPARNLILKLLGSVYETRAASIGGALALGAAAMSGLRTAIGGVASGLSSGGSRSSGSAAEKSESDARMDEMGNRADSPVSGSASQQDKENDDSAGGKTKDGTIDDIPSKEEEKTGGSDKDSEKTAEDILNSETNTDEQRMREEESDKFARGAQDFETGDSEIPTPGDSPAPEPHTEDTEKQTQQEETGDSSSKHSTPMDDVDTMGGNDKSKDSDDKGDDATAAAKMSENVSSKVKDEITRDGLMKKGKDIDEGVAEKGKDVVTDRAYDVYKSSKAMETKDDSYRYRNFNMSRLANLENMGRHQEQIKGMNKSIAVEQASMARHEHAASVAQKRLDELEKSSPKGNRANAALRAEIKSVKAERDAHDEAAKAANKNIQNYKVEQINVQSKIDAMREKEADFAKVAHDRGMAGGQTFKDAKSFAEEMKTAERMREKANFQNFKTEEIKGFLTPEDRMQFERSERIRNKTIGIAKAASVVAASAAAVGAAAGGTMVMAATGDEQNMQMFARYAGAAMVPGAANFARGAVDTAAHVVRRNEELAPDIEEAYEAAGKAFKKRMGEVHTEDGKLFGVG